MVSAPWPVVPPTDRSARSWEQADARMSAGGGGRGRSRGVARAQIAPRHGFGHGALTEKPCWLPKSVMRFCQAAMPADIEPLPPMPWPTVSLKTEFA